MRQILNNLSLDLQYYPTPAKMINHILDRNGRFINDLDEINFLEPSAGDGAICREIKQFAKTNNTPINIDCLEIEPILQGTLKEQGFNVIADDFLTFESMPIYNLIVMNPPFEKGATFLLKAYNMLSANGWVICILNAQTIENPCTKEREQLLNLIERTGEYETIEGAFNDAERKTGVDTAIVVLTKASYETEFDIFGNIKEDILTDDELIKEQLKDKIEETAIMPCSEVDRAINIYRSCVKEVFNGIDTVKKIKNSLSYLTEEAAKFNIDPKEFIKIILEEDEGEAKEETIKKIRKMVWSYVLTYCNMDEYLYTERRNEFYDKLDKGSSMLSFTKDNILQFFNNIFRERHEYFNQGVVDLFEKITSYHNGNRYHSEGWKTNKNWKINKKIIVDWGISFDKYQESYNNVRGKFSLSYNSGLDWLNDLDKVVRKIEGVSTKYGFIKELLYNKFNSMDYINSGEKFDNTVITPYFELKFFKKGSLHIVFKDDKVLSELNLMGAKLRTDLGYDDFGKKEE